MSRKRKDRPMQEAPVGSTWELVVNEVFACLVAVVGEREPLTGNYPCVVLAHGAWWSSKPGSRIGAAVTSARDWRRVT